MLLRTGRSLSAAAWRRSASSHAAGARLEFPGGEPEAPHVRTAIPGPKSLEMQKQLSTMQDAAGVKFFGARRAARPVATAAPAAAARSLLATPLLSLLRRGSCLAAQWPAACHSCAPGRRRAHDLASRSGLCGQPRQLRGGRGRQHAAGHVLAHRLAARGLQQPAHAGRLSGAPLRATRAAARSPAASRSRSCLPRRRTTCRCSRTGRRWATRRPWGGRSGWRACSWPPPPPACSTWCP